MSSHEEEIMDEEELSSVKPYKTLGITKSATADEIKSAYRKAALKHHPDKALDHAKEAAHTKFQEIAFAYAVLSDPVRRKRFDATGSTSESVDIDGFNWSDFYSEQFKDVVSEDAIEKFARVYKGSDEEKDDVLTAYTNAKGKWRSIFEMVILSQPLEDEDRFRKIIDEALETGDVQVYQAYTETAAQKAKRRKKQEEEMKSEAAEAEEMAKELGVQDALFEEGKMGKKKAKNEDALAALISQRGKSRMDDLVAGLEAKYAPKPKVKTGMKGKKRAEEEMGQEPSEEAFQAAAKRMHERKEVPAKGTTGSRKSKRAKK